MEVMTKDDTQEIEKKYFLILSLLTSLPGVIGKVMTRVKTQEIEKNIF